MFRLLIQIICRILCGPLKFPVRRYKSYYLSLITPVVVGICLGITLHMLYVGVECYTGEIRRKTEMPQSTSERIVKRSLNDSAIDDSNVDFVAKIVPIPPRNKSLNRNSTRKRFYRPILAHDELKIKEKLFVAILTSADALEQYGTAMDKTMLKHFPEVIFFISGELKSEQPDLKVVAFEHGNPTMLPLLVWTYIEKNHAHVYDFYLFITDRTYLRAERYYSLVKHISVKEDVYMGALGHDRKSCALEGGVLLSFSVMSQIVSELPWCTSNVQEGNPESTFGTCVHHASKKFCQPWSGDQTLMFYKLEHFNYEANIEQLKTDPYFNKSLTFYPMPDDTSFYKLHRYFCSLDLSLVQKRIAAAKDDILSLIKYAPGGTDQLTWPIGAPASYNPTNRFSVIQWTYFTETHMYLDNELTNLEEISGADQQDIEDIKRELMENINRKYPSKYQFEKIVNGYRRFDPTRGMEYTIDILLSNKTSNAGTGELKRVHLLRPLGKAELVKTPFVTESRPIQMVLPLKPEGVQHFEMFMLTFGHSCLDLKEDVSLTVVFLYSNSAVYTDPFEKSKFIIQAMSKKYNTKEKLSWKDLKNVESDIDIIDNIQGEFNTDDLILLTTVNTEMSQNFTGQYLNRVRLNTIKQMQVFFPMGFWQYRPNLIYDKKPYPASVEIGQKLGVYHRKAVDHASFYLSDYITAKSLVTTKRDDIFSLFIASKKFHVFRAVEPNLKLKWINVSCDPHLTGTKYQQCVTTNLEGLASQHHLAKLMYEKLSGDISKPDSSTKAPKADKQTSRSADKKVTPKPEHSQQALHQKHDLDPNVAPFMLKQRRVSAPKYKPKLPEVKLKEANLDKNLDDPLGEDLILVKKPK